MATPALRKKLIMLFRGRSQILNKKFLAQHFEFEH
jgi:hypothetical protein